MNQSERPVNNIKIVQFYGMENSLPEKLIDFTLLVWA